jgi:hypothetical protein
MEGPWRLEADQVHSWESPSVYYYLCKREIEKLAGERKC